MSNIINEVRAISSQKIAEKQKASELNYPKILEDIKRAAGWGQTFCELEEHKINQYTKQLLEEDGFHVMATTRTNKYNDYKMLNDKPVSIWRVSW